MKKNAKPAKKQVGKKIAKKKVVASKTSKKKSTVTNISGLDETNSIKKYPIIYSYIYEREQQDMRRILNEHKNATIPDPVTTQIIGFTVKNNQLVPVTSKTKK